VYDTKVLYPFIRPLVERSSDDFKRFALEGSPQNDCFGHYGMSVISKLYDHDLPSAIMIDHLHTSLLRQTKTIITHLRELLSITELERLDTLLKHQSFPHTFNRRLPSFLNLAYVKGKLVSFLCPFVCGVRLLHGSPVVVVDRCIRQQLSSQLFDDYQRNVSQYFNKINTLTCHLHDHYPKIYEEFGSLSSTSTFPWIRTAMLVSMRDLPAADILIDVNKGFALRRIGKYSSEVVEEIVHTFVPLDDYCVASPKTDVCLYTSLSTKTNVLELATMMAPRRTVHTLSAYDSNSVSRLIGKDISRVLGHYHPDQIIKETKSIVHFVDNEFHSQKNGGRTLITSSSSTAVDDQHEIPRFSQTTAAIILKQISSNKIAFEYLSHTDMKLFLAAIFATVDDSYTISDIQESLTTFTQLVVAQTVFALRHCSSSMQESPPYQPCLAVSTLFLRLPFDVHVLKPSKGNRSEHDRSDIDNVE
ncbi:unnamed protein product, partial [Didymodactylos carnosus]